jgi:hypothetical protein
MDTNMRTFMLDTDKPLDNSWHAFRYPCADDDRLGSPARRG